ncbi:hypothetical protein RCL1_001121 [Eukaryota sp. TZLM3-RCL]
MSEHFETSLSSDFSSSLLQHRVFTDVQIIYHDFDFLAHKCVLASLSRYFRDLWTFNWADSHDYTLDFSHRLPVDTECFSQFLLYLYGQSIIITSSNAYSFLYLSRYFQVPQLLSFVNKLINEKFCSSEWLSKVLILADSAEDELMILDLLPRFLSLSFFHLSKPLVFSVDSLKLITSEIKFSTDYEIYFISKIIVDCFLKSKFDLDLFLVLLTRCNFNSLSLKIKSRLISPVFNLLLENNFESHFINEIDLSMMTFTVPKEVSLCFDNGKMSVSTIDLLKCCAKISENPASFIDDFDEIWVEFFTTSKISSDSIYIFIKSLISLKSLNFHEITSSIREELIVLSSTFGFSDLCNVLSRPFLYSDIIVQSNLIDPLFSVLPPIKSFSLLFRASEHAFRASSFHSICHDVSPFLLVVENEHGDVFGGFSTVPFVFNGFSRSDCSFIFVIKRNGEINVSKSFVTANNQAFALKSDQKFGPLFGGDLKISDSCDVNRNSCLRTVCYEPLPCLSSSSFRIKQYEIFKVELAYSES